MRYILFAVLLVVAAGNAEAQTPAHDPSTTLQSVLPADVAARVLDRIAQARARDLPAQALEHRALELAAKGASAPEVERRVDEYAKAMEIAHDALRRARGGPPHDEEVAAGGDVVARGVEGHQIAELAKTAPADRPIAVPLYVLGALMERGLATQTAFDRVSQALARRATDAELEAQVRDLPPAVADHRPDVIGPDAGAANRPSFAGPPAAIPTNPGRGATPPVSPPVRGRPPMT